MKAVGLLVGLCVCLSSGQLGVVGSELGPNDNLNTYAKIIGKNYAGNEMLRNNGIQNNWSFNSRRFFDDVNVQKGSDTKLVLSKNKSLDQGNGDGKCYSIVDILKDLKLALTNSISEEKQNLKTLLDTIRVFILKNRLQNAPFSVVVNEIKKMLSETVNTIPARIQDLNLILQRLKEGELYKLLLEIRSRPDLSIQVVVIKLARILYRLKQDLVKLGFSPEIVKLVLKGAAQMSVPVVTYFLEKECKIKTQKYIVQYLEAALNLKLENSVILEGLDKSLNSEKVSGTRKSNLDVLADLGVVAVPWNDQGNPSAIGNLGILRGTANQGSLAGQGNVENLNALNTEVGSGSSVNMGNQGNSGDQAGPISTGNSQGLNNIKNIISPSIEGPVANRRSIADLGLGSVSGVWNEEYVNGLEGLLNIGNPSGIGNLGSLGSAANQGNLGGLGNAENVNSLETQVGPGILINMGNQRNTGDQAGPINTGNTQGVNGFQNMISPSDQGPVVYRRNLEVLEDVGGPWNEQYINSLVGLLNQRNPSGLGNLGSLKGASNQGSLNGLGNVENVNALETQVGPGVSVNMGNQGNSGDQAGPINTGNTQGLNGFKNIISPKDQGPVIYRRNSKALLRGLKGVRSPWIENYVNDQGGVKNQGNPLNIGNLGSLVGGANQGNLGGLENVGNSHDQAGLVNVGNTPERRILEDLAGFESVAGPRNEGYVNGVGGIINKGNPFGIGTLETLGVLKSIEPWNQGYVNGVGGVINKGSPLGIGQLGVLGDLKRVGEPWNEGHDSAVVGIVDEENLSGIGNLGNLENVGNQGSIAGQENVENINALETQVGPGILINMGNQGNSGDQAGPIDTGNTQGVKDFENTISPQSQRV